MKSLKNILAVCLIMFTGVLFAAKDTPMQLLKKMRTAAVSNNIPQLLELTTGELLETIKNTGAIPAAMRGDLLFISAAFEDIHVRLANPAKAEVHGFIKDEGKLIYLNIQMQHNESADLRIASIKREEYIATPFLNKFLAACRTNTLAQYRDLITKELTEKYAEIPPGFKNATGEKVTPKKLSAASAVYAIDRDGIKGNIQMTLDGYYWKISGFDAILAAAFPSKVLEQFCADAKKAKEPADLSKYLSDEVAGKITAEDISRFAAFASITNEKFASAHKYNLEIKVDSEKETGPIYVELAFKDTDWKITKYDGSFIYLKEFSPAEIMKKFIDAIVIKCDFDGDAVKALFKKQFPEALRDKVKEASAEATYTISSENITKNKAEIVAAVSKSNSAEKIEMSLTLSEGKWFIDTVNITPPPPKSEQDENPSAE